MKKGPKKVKTDLLKTTEENEIYLDYFLFKYSLLNITSSSSSSNIESGALLGLFWVLGVDLLAVSPVNTFKASKIQNRKYIKDRSGVSL